MDLGIILILTALAGPAPSPSPAAPPADPCGAAHTALLAALNRPTIGFSPCAVKPRDVVFEAGYANQTGGQSISLYPQGFLRYGVSPNLEVDFIGPSGKFDSGVGAKYEVAHDDTSALGLDLLYTMPTGSAVFSAGAPVMTFNVDYSHDVGSRFGFGTTAGIAHYGAVTALVPSVVFSNQFNSRAQLYAEAYASTKLRPDGGSLFGLDGGAQYLLSPQVEVDAEIGRTQTDVAASHYVGFGFGVRF